MKIVFDMNLSPSWLAWLAPHGFDAVHWANVGASNASDEAIMEWARTESRVVVTSDQ